MTKETDGPRTDRNYVHAYRDASNGEQAVRSQHEAEWDAEYGDKRRKAELEVDEARLNEAKARQHLEKTEADLAATDRTKKRRDSQRSGDESHDKFSDWNWYDQIVVCSALVTCVMLLGLGVTNVAVTILSSGIPAFSESPWIAWMLGGLVPAASFAVKFGYHLFVLDRHRHQYATAIYVLAFAFIIVWVYLFSQTFEGATGDIDWENLSEGNGHGSLDKLRTMTQILGEITIGAALFLVIDRVREEYAPDSRVANPDFLEKCKDHEIAQAAHAVSFEQLIKVEGELDRLLASKKAFVERAVAEWIAQITAGKTR